MTKHGESGHFQFAWWEVMIMIPFALAAGAIDKVKDIFRGRK